MGAIRVEVSGAGGGDQAGIHRSGEMVHHGPYTILRLAGGGHGSVEWNKRVGIGEYWEGATRRDLQITYRGQGAYAFTLRGEGRVTGQGHIREDVPRDPGPALRDGDEPS